MNSEGEYENYSQNSKLMKTIFIRNDISIYDQINEESRETLHI